MQIFLKKIGDLMKFYSVCTVHSKCNFGCKVSKNV